MSYRKSVMFSLIFMLAILVSIVSIVCLVH